MEYKKIETVKTIFVGGPGAGKTSIVQRILSKPFNSTHFPTVGIDFNLISIEMPHQNEKLTISSRIWDVGGKILENRENMELLRMMSQACDLVFLVIDGAKSQTLQQGIDWLQLMHQWIPKNIPKILVAQKADKLTRSLIQSIVEPFFSKFNFSDWFLTVGDPMFGDYDFRRGYGQKQVNPLDMFKKCIKKYVLVKRIPSANTKAGATSFTGLRPPESIRIPALGIFSIPTDLPVLFDRKLSNGEDVEEPSASVSFCDPKFFPTEDNKNKHLPPLANGWEYYGGMRTEDDARDFLCNRCIGSFLVIRCQSSQKSADSSNMLYVCMKTNSNQFDFIPISATTNDSRNNSFFVDDLNHELSLVCFPSLQELLVALNLYLGFGLQFRRIASSRKIYYEIIT